MLTAHNGLLCSDEVATKLGQIFLFSAVEYSICQILSIIILTALYLSHTLISVLSDGGDHQQEGDGGK